MFKKVEATKKIRFRDFKTIITPCSKKLKQQKKYDLEILKFPP